MPTLICDYLHLYPSQNLVHVTCMLHEITVGLHDSLTCMLLAWCYINVHACFMLHAWNWDVLHECTMHVPCMSHEHNMKINMTVTCILHACLK